MKAGTPVNPPAGSPSRAHLLRRSRKDAAVRFFISSAGVLVMATAAVLFLYLLWVVAPLFVPAAIEASKSLRVAGWQGTRPVYLSIEEGGTVGLRIAASGQWWFFNTSDGALIRSGLLAATEHWEDADEVVQVTESVGQPARVALATSGGKVFLLEHRYERVHDRETLNRRIIDPALSYPYGVAPLMNLAGERIASLALSETAEALSVVAAFEMGVAVYSAARTTNQITGELILNPVTERVELPFSPTGIAIDSCQKFLYLGDQQGNIHTFDLPAKRMVQSVRVSDRPVTALGMLLGGTSLLVGDESGVVRQFFPVDAGGGRRLQLIRQFEPLAEPVAILVPEQRRKGFMAVGRSGGWTIYHATTGRRMLQRAARADPPIAAALAPRANLLVAETRDGVLELLSIRNRHPEFSFSALWQKIWYENDAQPRYVWQSSSAVDDFEPKFSLAPLVLGTVKAALYALMFAVPLALMGAIYTACFMSPRQRRVVKPTIEVMAALPTVVLGFVAGLWFAPYIEAHLAGIIIALLVSPVAVVIGGIVWTRYRDRLPAPVARSSEALYLIPVLVLVVAVSLGLDRPVQNVFFDGQLSLWLTARLGIAYEQRNAMVVGFAMGFAIIPTIFTIAEDALYGVPKSLTNGALALGASPWQCVASVVIPSAMPGLFSALMIGLGRAVGETMIVLMATGNTPIMDWNLFDGMRTLAANLAMELPESEVGSSHYRILFLAALVLFALTFAINSVAEVVRQRFRERFSEL